MGDENPKKIYIYISVCNETILEQSDFLILEKNLQKIDCEAIKND